MDAAGHVLHKSPGPGRAAASPGVRRICRPGKGCGLFPRRPSQGARAGEAGDLRPAPAGSFGAIKEYPLVIIGPERKRVMSGRSQRCSTRMSNCRSGIVLDDCYRKTIALCICLPPVGLSAVVGPDDRDLHALPPPGLYRCQPGIAFRRRKGPRSGPAAGIGGLA